MRLNFDMDMENCIEDCMNCYRLCQRTVADCLCDLENKRHISEEHLAILFDCAKICSTSADFMLRHSPRHGDTCGLCATICETCAEECDKIADDPQLRECARLCRKCAQSCQNMWFQVAA